VPNHVFGWGRLDIPAAYAVASERMDPVLARRVGAPRVLPPRQ
jgi:hypothetical protein